MERADKLLLDMTPEGAFRAPARPSWSTRVVAVAVIIAVLAGTLAAAAFALWLALLLVPVAIGAVLVVVAMVKLQSWRARRHAARNQAPSSQAIRPR